LVYKDAIDPQDCVPFSELLEQSLVALVSTCHTSLVEVSAGATLKSVAITYLNNILDSIIDLSKALANKQYQNNNIPKLTGIVWDCCTVLKKLKLDNESIITEKWNLHIATLRDAYQELKDFHSNMQHITETVEKPKEEDIDEDQDDLQIAKEIKEQLPGCILLAECCYRFTDTLQTKLIGILKEDGQNMSWLEECLQMVQQMTELIDELAYNIYEGEKKISYRCS